MTTETRETRGTHTPGPRQVSFDPSMRKWLVLGPPRTAEDITLRKIVGTFDFEADALIDAAAPALLVALRDVTDALTDEINNRLAARKRTLAEKFALCKAARAAIAQAEGKEG